jgi:hypothetical protein
VFAPADILEMSDPKSFRPFRVSVSDGSGYDVRHAEVVLVGRSTLHVAMPNAAAERDGSVPYVRIALVHVTRLEPIDVQPRLRRRRRQGDER